MEVPPPPPPPTEAKSKKIIVIVLLLIIIAAIGAAAYIFMLQQPTKPSGPPSAPPSGPGAPPTAPQYTIVEIKNLKDLLSLVSSMEYRYTVNGNTIIVGSFEVTGSETVDGQECWVLDISYGQYQGKVWVSKADGSVVKAVSDGESGEVTKKIAEGFLGSFISFFTAAHPVWYHYWQVPTDVGTITPIGSETVQLGPTTLTVNKYRLDPSPQFKQDTGLESEEVWFAVLPQNKLLFVKVIMITEEGETIVWELTSISFY